MASFLPLSGRGCPEDASRDPSVACPALHSPAGPHAPLSPVLGCRAHGEKGRGREGSSDGCVPSTAPPWESREPMTPTPWRGRAAHEGLRPAQGWPGCRDVSTGGGAREGTAGAGAASAAPVAGSLHRSQGPGPGHPSTRQLSPLLPVTHSRAPLLSACCPSSPNSCPSPALGEAPVQADQLPTHGPTPSLLLLPHLDRRPLPRPGTKPASFTPPSRARS